MTIVRWDKPHWKPSRTARKKAERKVRVERITKEDREKAHARKRDKFCRFPLCGCRKLGLALQVAHKRHKGMGGNPAGDRSDRKILILLCSHRHQHGRISLHAGTLVAHPLTLAGYDGPVKWMIDVEALAPGLYRGRKPADRWAEVAREVDVQQLEPLADRQRQLLESLAEMDI